MFVRRHAVPVTTATGGAATGYTPTLNGRILAIRYVPHASTPLDTGADIVVTGAESGIAVLTQANIGTAARDWHPRAPTHGSADGAAALYASGGVAVNDKIPVADEALKIAVTNGADAKSGTFHVFVEG